MSGVQNGETFQMIYEFLTIENFKVKRNTNDQMLQFIPRSHFHISQGSKEKISKDIA